MTPPVTIAPAAKEKVWSVMIPVFNCAGYLRPTLESVLAQDPGSDLMQITVVDDCSTKDRPEDVVQEVGKGRVSFIRRPQNGGVTANFNTCVERSEGQLVHILHGDDFVLPGFYERMQSAAVAHPSASFLACRSFFVDEEGVLFGISERVKPLETETKDASIFYGGTRVPAPGVVIRRSFYETHGGYNPGLAHTADWEMWARAVSQGGGLVLRDVLCAYRVFSANDSGRLQRSADNLRDYERTHALFAGRYPDFDKEGAVERLRQLALTQHEHFVRQGDAEAAKANLAYWRQKATGRMRAKRQVLKVLRSLKNRFLQ